ncbi:hypothetical protein KAR91_25610 [Candidatus Pacearchaeota archaeon]|nr:hypothetical protein [Candidatus Pacearchaeota archaeon]
MKAIDLHVGYWYNSVKWDKPVILTAEDIHELVCRADGANISDYIDEMFTPIPLTEEWLIKFGFEKIIAHKDKRCIHYIINEIELLANINGDGIYDLLWGVCEIKYVHQLQNLYFCLFGKELNLVSS